MVASFNCDWPKFSVESPLKLLYGLEVEEVEYSLKEPVIGFPMLLNEVVSDEFPFKGFCESIPAKRWASSRVENFLNLAPGKPFICSSHCDLYK